MHFTSSSWVIQPFKRCCRAQVIFDSSENLLELQTTLTQVQGQPPEVLQVLSTVGNSSQPHGLQQRSSGVGFWPHTTVSLIILSNTAVLYLIDLVITASA